jgi:phenylacetate-CoA ligase
VPWYKRHFKKIGLDPGDIRSLEDLKRIPPLTRQEVVDHYRQMVDTRQRNSVARAERSRRDAGAPIPFARLRRHRLVRNSSSGSTGVPTVFFEDGAITALNWALELRHKHWYGVEEGAREARLVRLSTTFADRSLGNRWRRHLWHQLILPGANLRDADYEFCRSQLEQFEPGVLWGFTGALTGLADYVRRSGRTLSYRPALAVGWAAPLYDHEKLLLEDVFQCPASNIYSTREVGHIALGCPAGSLHINQEYLIVETERTEETADVAGGGEVLVTTLMPTPMPFIRYCTGDVARVGPSRCSCGRTLPVLEEFVGRTGEIFRTRDGRMISPNFWCRLFMAREISGAIRRFQVTYTRDLNIVVRIVRGVNFTPATLDYLNRFMLDNLAQATEFRIECVEEIKPVISGKYLMVQRES